MDDEEVLLSTGCLDGLNADFFLLQTPLSPSAASLFTPSTPVFPSAGTLSAPCAGLLVASPTGTRAALGQATGAVDAPVTGALAAAVIGALAPPANGALAAPVDGALSAPVTGHVDASVAAPSGPTPLATPSSLPLTSGETAPVDAEEKSTQSNSAVSILPLPGPERHLSSFSTDLSQGINYVCCFTSPEEAGLEYATEFVHSLHVTWRNMTAPTLLYARKDDVLEMDVSFYRATGYQVTYQDSQKFGLVRDSLVFTDVNRNLHRVPLPVFTLDEANLHHPFFVRFRYIWPAVLVPLQRILLLVQFRKAIGIFEVIMVL